MSYPNYHTQVYQQEQALSHIDDAAWREIVDLLPPDIIEQARICKAFTRARGLHDPLDLLRGIFSYVFCMGSFREVGAWALGTGLSVNGERSWAKRTRQAADWLLWLVQTLLIAPQVSEEITLPQGFTGRVHLVDATHLCTWKRTGETRRLHCSYDLFGKRLEQVVLTDHHVGEGLRHFSFQPGDIVVGDCAYCRRQAIIDQMDAGIDVVVRLHWVSAPLLHRDGITPFDLSAWLTQLDAQKTGESDEEVSGEVEVMIKGKGRSKVVPMRLVATRLSQAAATRAQKKRKAKASKNGRTSRDLTIQVADWLLVLTSLSCEQWSRQQVLALYKARWHIELLFKRIKQLVRLHRLRSGNLQSNQSVLAAMLVGWILMEQKANQLRANYLEKKGKRTWQPVSTWSLYAQLAQSFRSMIVGVWTWSQIEASIERLDRLLRYHPQEDRPHQESELIQHLGQIGPKERSAS
jgi:hypothetical protein